MNPIEIVIEARPRDLGGFTVRRALPSAQRRLIGPFIFFDQMGPAVLPPGQGLDVRPHPHIALATVTYLFAGEIIHRDSLGSLQAIRPGDVNWMLAGRGVVHSERSSADWRRAGGAVHGIQCWVALPTAHEEDVPWFAHHPAASIPRVVLPGAALHVIAGAAYGMESPVRVASPTLYVDAQLQPDAELPLPSPDQHAERAIYVVEGALMCDGRRFDPGALVVLAAGAGAVTVRALGETRLMLLGGAPLDGDRHIDWNFVSSSRARLDRARDDWRQGRFPKVPGDDLEFIPLPER